MKNGPNKAFLGTFWKSLTKKLGFFGARFPLKISMFGAEATLRKIVGPASQKWISQNSTKGTFWVGMWSNSWGGGGRGITEGYHSLLVSQNLVLIRLFQVSTPSISSRSCANFLKVQTPKDEKITAPFIIKLQ